MTASDTCAARGAGSAGAGAARRGAARERGAVGIPVTEGAGGAAATAGDPPNYAVPCRAPRSPAFPRSLCFD